MSGGPASAVVLRTRAAHTEATSHGSMQMGMVPMKPIVITGPGIHDEGSDERIVEVLHPGSSAGITISFKTAGQSLVVTFLDRDEPVDVELIGDEDRE